MDNQLEEIRKQAFVALKNGNTEAALKILEPHKNAPSADIQYIQSIAWLRAGHPSKSSAYMERAFQFAPGNPTLLLTHEYILKENTKQPDTDLWALNNWPIKRYVSDLDAMLVFSSLLLILMLLEYFKKKVMFAVRLLAMIVTIFSFGFYVNLVLLEDKMLGVVTNEAANLLQGPSLTFEVKQSIPSGSLVEITDHTRGWFHIRRSTNLKGWIPIDDVTPLFTTADSP
jgi:hypothetical protein